MNASGFFVHVSQEEVPPGIYYAHYRNVEKQAAGGKFDPNAGLAISGIAGTGTDKEDEDKSAGTASAAAATAAATATAAAAAGTAGAAADKTPAAPAADEEMKDVSKSGEFSVFFLLFEFVLSAYSFVLFIRIFVPSYHFPLLPLGRQNRRGGRQRQQRCQQIR